MPKSFSTTYHVRLYQDLNDPDEYVYSGAMGLPQANDLAHTASLGFAKAVIVASHARDGMAVPCQTTVATWLRGTRHVHDVYQLRAGGL